MFVVRTVSHSFLNKAGRATYLAFVFAQFASSLIAVFGFNGYSDPKDAIKDCQLCTLAHADESVGGNIPFWASREVPTAGTEGAYTASVLGCTYWVIVAWVWSAIWYIGLDPIKVLQAGVLPGGYCKGGWAGGQEGVWDVYSGLVSIPGWWFGGTLVAPRKERWLLAAFAVACQGRQPRCQRDQRACA